MNYFCMTVTIASLLASPLAAAGDMSPGLAKAGNEARMLAAAESGVCGDFPVLSVSYDAATNVIVATCGEDAEAFVPLLGGLVGPLAGLAGAGLLLGAAGGGGGPADTISP